MSYEIARVNSFKLRLPRVRSSLSQRQYKNKGPFQNWTQERGLTLNQSTTEIRECFFDSRTELPLKYISTLRAASRPSLMACTTRD